MKYEPIFGDQSLFDKATRKNTVAIYKISENLTVEFDKYEELLAFLQQQPLCDRPDIAMRIIIPEPKRWTVEDQNAGKLPDVGAEFKARGYVWECVRILNNTILAVSGDSYCGFELNECKPIESPEEKAARLREEWCNEAGLVCCLGMTTLTRIYDAMLSGDLPVPVKDGE